MNKKKLIPVFVIVLILFFVTAAKGDESIKIGVDGELWSTVSKLPESQSKLGKLLLIRGIYDGLWLGESPQIDAYYTKTSYEHLIIALDQFYSDYRNRKIHVIGVTANYFLSF